MAPEALKFISEKRLTRSLADSESNNGTDTSSPTTDYPPTMNDTSSTESSVSSMMSSTLNGTLTDITGAPSTPQRGGHSPEGTAVAVVITLILIGAFFVVIFIYMKRKGKLDKCFHILPKKRRSSTSDSRRALGDEHDEHDIDIIDNMDPPVRREEGEEMFTIDDFEDTQETQEGKEEYYYDEVFGQSQFEDEATNNAMRHLYTTTETQREEEMLDFDFETLGIKIDDYKIDPNRKNTL